MADNYQLLSFFPVSDDPTRSHMEMRLLVPPLDASGLSPAAWAEKWDKNWQILETVLLGEDFPLLRSIQSAYANQAATATVLGRYEDIHEVTHRPDVFSNQPVAIPPNLGQDQPLIPLEIDPPEHTNYRQVLTPLFSPARMQALEPQIRSIVNDLLDGFAAR